MSWPRKQPIRSFKKTRYWLLWIFGRVGVSHVSWWRQSSKRLPVSCRKWSLLKYRRTNTSRQPRPTIFAAYRRWSRSKTVGKWRVSQGRYPAIKSSSGYKACKSSIYRMRPVSVFITITIIKSQYVYSVLAFCIFSFRVSLIIRARLQFNQWSFKWAKND